MKASSRVNVALSGTAFQLTTYSYGNAEHAIDGSTDPELTHSSCTHTQQQVNPWWRLQLPGVYRVSEIEVTNRNSYRDRLNDMEIRIGNSLENNGNNNPRCAIIHDLPDTLTQTVQCRGMEGSFLGMDRNITLLGKRLCWSDAVLHCRDLDLDLLSIRGPEDQEIVDELVANASFPLTSHLWVGLRRSAAIQRTTESDYGPSKLDHFGVVQCSCLGIPCGFPGTKVSQHALSVSSQLSVMKSPSSRVNVALSGTAIQSSTYPQGNAEHAIDGNTDPVLGHSSCANTYYQDKPWWRLQLPELVPSISFLGMDRNITLLGTRLCWSDALLYCRDLDLDLLSIRGPEDQEMVDELMANASFPLLTSHLWYGTFHMEPTLL
ncbi:hypothetical protein CRUP_019656 [Coryphaenoides rupestris]|nr:hypothetical protein CRUP_019656 [Coryphaenoides rupestris]